MAETSSAEAEMRKACDAILRGDIMSALSGLTPEAFAEAMALGAEITALPTPESYVIESQEEIDGEFRFRVRFKTSSRDIVANATWRLVDGAWKITHISADGLR